MKKYFQPANVTIEWDMHQLDDGNYDIRAYSECGGVRSYSEVKSGHKDTRKPEPLVPLNLQTEFYQQMMMYYLTGLKLLTRLNFILEQT